MVCPRCGEETGLDLGGKAFCVLCESQSRSEYSGYLAASPGVFQSWKEAGKVLLGLLAFWSLVGTAIYELVKW
jgi:hypothetical protein